MLPHSFSLATSLLAFEIAPSSLSSAHSLRELFVNMLHNELFPTLKRHELEEQVVPVTALESQRSASEPLTATLEAAHRVAFRSGLGNSIFATQEEPVTLSQVAAHVSKLRADEVALIGTGISHETLVKLAEPLFGEELTYELEEAGYDLSVKQSTVPSVYKGGESRAAFDLHSLESHGPSVVIAYGVTGKDKVPSLAEATVLGQLLGGSPAIKWSSGSSPLAQAASAVEGQATARAFVQSYSDAALLCIQIEAEGTKRLSEVAAHAGKTVKSLQSVSKEQLARAVAQAKYEIAAKSETDEGLVELVAPQIFSGKVDDLKTVFAALDAITPESISKVRRPLSRYLLRSRKIIDVVLDRPLPPSPLPSPPLPRLLA